MTVIELLMMVWAHGLTLERRGCDIVVHGADAIHPALIALLREHKSELLRVMTDRAADHVRGNCA